MPSTLTAQPPVAELLRPLSPGAIVRLPDDSIAEVVSSDYETVTVVHGYLRAAGAAGSGPWDFERWQVEEASALEREEYRRMATRISFVVVWS